jgi:hypothetical protein
MNTSRDISEPNILVKAGFPESRIADSKDSASSNEVDFESTEAAAI